MNVAEELRKIRETRLELAVDKMAKSLGYAGGSSYQRYENATLWENKKFPDKFVEKLVQNFVGRGNPPIDSEELFRLAYLSSYKMPGAPEAIYLSGLEGSAHHTRTVGSAPLITAEQVEMFSSAKKLPAHLETENSTPKHSGPRSFRLRVTNKSMEPTFYEGDELLCDPDADYDPGDYVIAKLDGEIAATVRQYREIGYDENNEKIVELRPANPNFPPVILTKQRPGKIYAAVVALSRRLLK